MVDVLFMYEELNTMGLDNYPKPDPCKVLENAGKLKIIRDEKGDVDCSATACPLMKRDPDGIYCCWIRGKIYNEYVYESCEESLYQDKTRDELVHILQSMKKHYKKPYSTHLIPELIEYLEILLSIQEWGGKLVAWF